MNEIEKFELERKDAIATMANDQGFRLIAKEWMQYNTKHKYAYNFKWMGRPIIQLPTDIVVLQELIWEVKPDLIIETGIAHGGSLIFTASMLELLGQEGCVVGIDIDIRKHNRVEIEKHPMSKRITMLEGSSTDREIFNQITAIAQSKKKVMVFLDSCHTHEHVLQELKLYANLVSKDSYIVVFDTSIQFEPDEYCNNRPWGVGNNPWTAVQEFLKGNQGFIIDKSIADKLVLTSVVDGYLKRIK